MPFGLGVGEVLLIFAVLLLVFGAKRLPELGGALGKGIREFKHSVREIEGELTRPADTTRELKSPPVSAPQAASGSAPSAESGETQKPQG